MPFVGIREDSKVVLVYYFMFAFTACLLFMTFVYLVNFVDRNLGSFVLRYKFNRDKPQKFSRYGWLSVYQSREKTRRRRLITAVLHGIVVAIAMGCFLNVVNYYQNGMGMGSAGLVVVYILETNLDYHLDLKVFLKNIANNTDYEDFEPFTAVTQNSSAALIPRNRA